MRIKPLNLWTFLINSSMKKTSDSIALIRNNFSNFKQNFSIIWLFLSSQPKINCKAYYFTSLAYVQLADFFAECLKWVGFSYKFSTFISNQHCQFGPISLTQSVIDTFFHLAFDAQIYIRHVLLANMWWTGRNVRFL